MGNNFTNTNQGGQTADNAVSGLTGPVTVAFHFWNLQPGSNNWASGMVFSLANSNEWQRDALKVLLSYSASQAPAVLLTTYHATTDGSFATARDMPDSAWTGVALKYDPTDPSTDAVIYVDDSADTWSVASTNGVGAYETQVGGSASPDTVLVSKIGASFTGVASAGGTDDSSLAEMAVWGALQSDAALSDVSGGSSALFYTGDLLYYDRMTTTTPDDEVGGNDITWVNAPGSTDHPSITYPGAGGSLLATQVRSGRRSGAGGGYGARR